MYLAITDHSNLDLTRLFLGSKRWSASTEINLLSDKPIVLDLGAIKPQFEWIIGGNYWHESIARNEGELTVGQDFISALNNLARPGADPVEVGEVYSRGVIDTDAQIQTDNGAIFGETSVELFSVKLTGGVRYSSITREFVQLRNHPLVAMGNVAAAQNTVRLATAGRPIPAGLPSLAEAQATLAQENRGTLCALENGGCERTWEAVTWKVALQYDVPDDLIPFVDPLLYFTVSTGNRPGGYNFSPDDDFEEEDLFAIEGGVKSSLWDNRIELNIGGFFYQLEDAQINQVFGGIPTVQNIPDAEMFGIEIEMRAEPITGMRVNFGFGWQESEITSSFCTTNQGVAPRSVRAGDLPDPGCPDTTRPSPNPVLANQYLAPDNLEGNGLPRVPQFNISFGVEYEYDVPQIQGSVTGRLDVVWRDDTNYFQFDNPRDVQEAYAFGGSAAALSASQRKLRRRSLCGKCRR